VSKSLVSDAADAKSYRSAGSLRTPKEKRIRGAPFLYTQAYF
jgi:hypothetical protein